jgi:hypothetical protein
MWQAVKIWSIAEFAFDQPSWLCPICDGVWGIDGWGKRPCVLVPSQNKARLSLKQLPQWVKLLMLPAMSFIALANPKWSANLSRGLLLRLQAVVSLTQFAYGWWRWRDLQYFARAAYTLPSLRSQRCDIISLAPTAALRRSD